MARAAAIGDLFCTATGGKHVLAGEHFEAMKDGAIIANTGHFDVELDLPALRSLAVKTEFARELVEEFTLADGRRLYLIGEGRAVNLAAADGDPALVMDMSFANQALSVEYAVRHAGTLEHKVYPVPVEIDEEIARLKLAATGTEIDALSADQADYLSSWGIGT
jgi:adenosylhomocysteinase